MKFALLTLFLALSCVAGALGQLRVLSGAPLGAPHTSGPMVFVMKGDSVLRSMTFDQDRDTNVIVLFKDPPLSARFEMRKALPGGRVFSVLDGLLGVHQRFKSDLRAIEAMAAQRPTTAAASTVRFEYFIAVDGIALRMSQGIIAEVRRLPYVSGIYIDAMVSTLDDASNTLVGAPGFWDAYSLKGENIDIAILDTGIDYLHEALGGAPFPNAKVVGGSDIINGDNDPMDDHGHGTHVAGIAAGDGPPPMNLRGVAPKARLWAFKVLNAGGSGYSSQVIAGIEKALDPDGDPSTPTPIKVISMSLGGSGDPGDPLSQAVDNAVASGVVCAVAAGNNGPAYQSISSPGCAKGALTVGASTNADAVASFSSRGGTDLTFAIKPDVTAPGSQIVSAKLGGGYIARSGTSMATPHVAGAAALLRELHPEWPPAEIKAVLMASAHNLGANVWSQGSGRIDLAGAGIMLADVTPGSVSLGMVDHTLGLWSRTDTLTVHNHRATPQTFALSVRNALPGGVGVALHPSSMTVAPGDSASFEVATSVDNTIYGYPAGTPPAYENRIVVRSTSTSDSVSVPIAFIDAPFMTLKFDKQPLLLFIQNKKGKYLIKEGSIADSLVLLLPNDTYDILVDFDFAHAVLREHVVQNGTSLVMINSSEARHQIVLRSNDLAGNNTAFGNNIFNRYIVPKGAKSTDVTIGWLFIGYPYETPFFVSDVSADYTYFSKVSSVFPSGDFAAMPFVIAGGISNDTLLQNDSGRWKQLDYTYPAPANLAQVHVFNETNGWFSQVLARPFHATSYVAPVSSPSAVPEALQQYLYAYQTVSSGADPFFSTDPVLYRTGIAVVSDPDTVKFYNEGNTANPLLTTTAGPVNIPVGEGAPLWIGRTWNTASVVSLGPGQLNSKGYFVSPHGDLSFSLFPYVLLRGDSVIRTGTFLNGYCIGTGVCAGDPGNIATITPGPYRLRATYGDYSIGNVRGAETVTLDFDLGALDKNPPALTRLEIFSDGTATDVLLNGSANEVVFSVADPFVAHASGVASVETFMRLLGDASWRPLALTIQDSTYRARLPDGLPGGYYSLRIVMRDSTGNVLDDMIEPAFEVPGPAFSAVNFAFGTVSAACRSTKRFSLKNTDPAVALTVRSIASDDPDFTVSPASRIIEPLAEGSFEITFHPGSQGSKAGNIIVAHSAKAAPDTLTVSGIGIGADSGAISMTASYGTDWQLVSLPVTGCPMTLSPLFEFSSSYVQRDTLLNGRGYWTKLLDSSIAFSGYPLARETSSVNAGWNIVGSITNNVAVGALLTIPPGILGSPFFGFDRTYYIADSIAAGHAYWVRATQAGELVVGSGPAGPPLKPAAEDILSRSNFLAIADALGRTQRLYFIDGHEAGQWPERLSLPPAPPGDAFDARFSSGHMLVATAPGKSQEFPVSVSSAHYPIRFTLHTAAVAIDALLEVSQEAFALKAGATVELAKPASRITLRLNAQSSTPARFQLGQNYPNPFNPTTTISYGLPRSSAVRLEIFTALGQKIGVLIDEFQAAGLHEATFDARALPSGVYFYRLQAGTFADVKKMLLMR